MIKKSLPPAFLVAAGLMLAAQAPAPVAPTAATVPAAALSNRELLRQSADRFAENCSSCHGVPGSPGERAPYLFDTGLLGQRSDEQLAATVTMGAKNGEMPAFGEMLDQKQIWQLLSWVRLQSGIVQARPAVAPDPDGVVIASEAQKFRLKVVARGIGTPWGMSFLPDGRMLVTDRAGPLRIIDRDGRLDPKPVTGTPKVWVRQDAGMLDVAIDPDYAKNGWIYIAYAELKPGFVVPPAKPLAPGESAPRYPSMTVLARGKLSSDGRWTDEQTLYRAPVDLYTPDGSHYGSRLLFDDSGHLFFSIGERGEVSNSQRLDNALGKVLRINTDGSIPADNPFVGRAGAMPAIWSYGHRNPQGLAWAPGTGLMWETEHGPNGGDEVNIVRRGANYGWGVVSNGLQPGIDAREAPGMVSPIAWYTPTIAPSGIGFYTGNKYPGWKNNLFVAGLAGQQLRRLVIEGEKITHQEVLLRDYGRVRAVTTGPDGLLYFLLQSPTGGATGISLSEPTPGMVVRIEPLP